MFLTSAIKKHGGLKNTIRKAMRLYHSGGWDGVGQGIRSAIQLYAGPVAKRIVIAFDERDYTKWINRYDRLNDHQRTIIRSRIEQFPTKPLISVIMPTYNPHCKWLIKAIDSVRAQLYQDWELCIADDASTNKEVRDVLEHYAKLDSRIKVLFRQQNGHISASSNSALEIATGEWIALLDHDDELSEHALFWVVDTINKKPDVCLIYSDEDKISVYGKRMGPYFKCDWNEDLFYSHNMISHLGVYKADIVKAVNGFRVGLEGSQDYDLALRFIEKIKPEQIYHIPRILYHWRMHAESSSQSLDAKPYALIAGEKALEEHFQRIHTDAKVEIVNFSYRVNYTLPEVKPMVSLIIPTRNGLSFLQRCCESILRKTTYSHYEILIIDNGSDDPEVLQYLQKLQSDAKMTVIRDDQPFNYSALNNNAVKYAQGDIIGLLNNDLEVISPDWLSEMVSIAIQPGVGAVGARLWYPNNKLQHGGVILGIGGCAGHSYKHLPRHSDAPRANLIQSFSAVSAACLVVKKSIYERVGGLNETDLHVEFNDVDFCLRIREAGYRNVWTPYAELYHYESATRGLEKSTKKLNKHAQEVKYMKDHWSNIIAHDPAYSPNLTLYREDYSLGWPPRTELLS